MGFIVFSPNNLSVIKTRLWLNDDNLAEQNNFLILVEKEIEDYLLIEKTVLVNYHPGYFALPSEIFRKDKLNYWTELLNGLNPIEKMLIKSTDDSDIVHIQPIKKKFHEKLMQKYQDLSIFSFREFAFQRQVYEKDTMCVTFQHQHIFITLYSKGTLQLNQVYSFESPEDVIYLLLNITDHFFLDKSTLTFIPEGFVDADSVLYKLVEQYFPNMQLPDKINYNYPEETEHLSPFILRYFDRIISCVS